MSSLPDKNERQQALVALAEIADAMELPLGESVSVEQVKGHILRRLAAPSTTRQTGLHIQTGKLVSEKYEDVCEQQYVAAEDAIKLERELAEAQRDRDQWFHEKVQAEAASSATQPIAVPTKLNDPSSYAMGWNACVDLMMGRSDGSGA